MAGRLEKTPDVCKLRNAKSKVEAGSAQIQLDGVNSASET
jgi:hypothetical protein